MIFLPGDLMADKIFQRFDLDASYMTRLVAMKPEGTFDDAGKTLGDELRKKGYLVLISNGVHYGVPGSIIVGGELGMNIKGDFWEIAGRWKLPFSSGPFYTMADGKDEPEKKE